MEDKNYIALLWNESGHDIKEFTTLSEAIMYLVAHGANFEHREIVKKINWLPGENTSSQATAPASTETAAPVTKTASEDEELAKRPNPPPLPVTDLQPVTVNPAGSPVSITNPNGKMKRHIFEGILPEAIAGPLFSGE